MKAKDASALFRLLGDEVRLRILRVLTQERLNVTELTGVVGIAQSGVSRHLGLLREGRLVIESREGGFTYYRAAVPDGDPAPDSIWAVLLPRFNEAPTDPVARADAARLQEVRRVRKENFEAHGAERWQAVPGRSWAAWSRALGYLLPPVVLADVGCGEGYLTIEAARWARRVVAIDRSGTALASARDRARRRRVTNVDWQRGLIEQLPLADAAVDVVLLSQALHHAERPELALREACRVLVSGGRLLVLDLRAHEQTWVRERFDDRWLGFEDAAFRSMLTTAGFDEVDVRVGARLTGDPFTVLVASGVKRAPDRKAKGSR